MGTRFNRVGGINGGEERPMMVSGGDGISCSSILWAEMEGPLRIV